MCFKRHQWLTRLVGGRLKYLRKATASRARKARNITAITQMVLTKVSLWKILCILRFGPMVKRRFRQAIGVPKPRILLMLSTGPPTFGWMRTKLEGNLSITMIVWRLHIWVFHLYHTRRCRKRVLRTHLCLHFIFLNWTYSVRHICDGDAFQGFLINWRRKEICAGRSMMAGYFLKLVFSSFVTARRVLATPPLYVMAP